MNSPNTIKLIDICSCLANPYEKKPYRMNDKQIMKISLSCLKLKDFKNIILELLSWF